VRLAVESIRELIAAAERGQQKVLCAVRELSDADLARASLLPGWSRRHVVAHLAGNARGQLRMLRAASRGELADQYPGGASGRAAEIEELALLSGTRLGSQLGDACDALVEVWNSVWARWRESEVHHVDLDVGYSPNNWPSAFV
jgi:maleylpyruvate isomerase